MTGDWAFVPRDWMEMDASRLTLDSGRFSVGDRAIADFRADGRGSIRAMIDEVGQTSLTARLTSFELRGLGESTAASGFDVLVRGADFRLEARGDAIDLAKGAPDLDVNLWVAESAIPELAAYNRFLPSGTPLELRAGTGSVTSEMAFNTADDSGSGWVDMRIDDATLAFNNLEASGSARFTLALRGAELVSRRFDVSGTRLELLGFSAAEAGGSAEDAGWSGRVELGRAEIQASRPPALQAEFKATLSDSRPIVALLVEQKPLVGWIADLLIVKDVSARGRLGVDSHAWAVDDLQIVGKGLEVLGDGLRIAPDRREALFYFSRGPLSAAVELADGERNWKFLKARAWYLERADSTRSR